ncbi:unnamed protein product [Haemonchus placei]|uniref:Uncharacterized protein n=1 Tax=Haemonchus placei TaxID=6290 RepID=A0A0N4WDJ1_HAEPC|nr:unnamed protein product [Haemonchus placei]
MPIPLVLCKNQHKLLHPEVPRCIRFGPNMKESKDKNGGKNLEGEAAAKAKDTGSQPTGRARSSLERMGECSEGRHATCKRSIEKDSSGFREDKAASFWNDEIQSGVCKKETCSSTGRRCEIQKA